MQITELITSEGIKYLGCVIIGGLLGLVISNLLSNHSKDYQLLYISQEELLQAEATRIASEQVATKELFFGKVEEAAKLAVEIGKEYELANKASHDKVVYSLGAVTGDNVHSLSKKVHQLILERLKNRIQRDE